jgi:hypothetical protein
VDFEILDIEPGRNEDDVVVTVGYWYDDRARARSKPPDYVDHQEITGIELVVPRRNRLGQFYGLDGVLVSPYEEVDGDWVPMEPDPAKHQMQEVPLGFVISEAVMLRSWKVLEEQPKGGSPRSGVEGNPSPKHMAHSLAARDLKGYSRRLDPSVVRHG